VTFVTAGVIMAVKRAREDRRLVLLRGACPRCGANQEFKPGGRFASERNLDCPKCHGNLTLVDTSEATHA
jgi:transposase-like protein